MSSSENKSDVSSHSAGKSQRYLDMVHLLNELTSSSGKLKRLRREVNWEIEAEREKFYDKFYNIVFDWKGSLPNLQDIFKPDEINCIFSDFAMTGISNLGARGEERLIEFMARCDCKYEPKVDENGKPSSRRTTLLHLAFRYNLSILTKNLFKIYNRFDVNYTDESGLSHFHIACDLECEEIVKKFLKLGQDPNLVAQDESVDPPLHSALNRRNAKLIKLLLKHKANPNLPSKDGSTPLHITCKKLFRDAVDLATILFNFSNDEPLQVDAQDKLGQTPLHLALRNMSTDVVELLLRGDANPNLADAEGLTPLHIICKNYRYYSYDSVEMIFELSNNRHQPVKVNARDNLGNTPLLHLSLNNQYYNFHGAVKLLLMRGADLNIANEEGLTPLHIVCKEVSHYLMTIFFNIIDEVNKVAQIDARDNEGNTPLHLALKYNFDQKVAEILLKRGANSILVNTEGCTPLHYICKRNQCDDDDLAELFLKITKDQQQMVQIDTKDKKGRTPLELAVANILPNTVNVLLSNGADLSSFVFPADSYFDEEVNPPGHGIEADFKLRLASGALLIVERLERSRYELDGSNALTIMKFFAKHRLFEKSADLEKHWYDDEEFAEKVKKIMVKPDLHLFDLIKLSPEEAKKQITYTDYYKFTRGIELWHLSEGPRNACAVHLCEKLSRQFFQSWAMEPFMELIHYRLPILCCDMIIEHLKNEDLYHICLAAADRSS